jgi:hypothetical protein
VVTAKPIISVSLILSLAFYAALCVGIGALAGSAWRMTQPQPLADDPKVADMVPREKYDALVRDFGSAEDEVKRLLSEASQPEHPAGAETR